MQMKIELKRFIGNPILKPNPENDWESQAVFNCAVLFKNGTFHLLYRAIGEYEKYISRLGYAKSTDGINFERMKDHPVLSPQVDYERFGCEDPRLMEIDGKIYVSYVVLSGYVPQGPGVIRTALATTEDFLSYQRLWPITPDISINKDCYLFPERIQGKYWMIHRPHNWIISQISKRDGRTFVEVDSKWIEWNLPEIPETFPEKPSIWLACSDDLKNWHDYRLLLEPEFPWENCKIGGGCPPVKTKHGWLLINHGVEDRKGKKIYRASAALVDLADPTKVLQRLEEPILSPECDYEEQGDVPHVVFPEGAVLQGEKLFVYYGGGDKCVNLAQGRVWFE